MIGEPVKTTSALGMKLVMVIGIGTIKEECTIRNLEATFLSMDTTLTLT